MFVKSPDFNVNLFGEFTNRNLNLKKKKKKRAESGCSAPEIIKQLLGKLKGCGQQSFHDSGSLVASHRTLGTAFPTVALCTL